MKEFLHVLTPCYNMQFLHQNVESVERAGINHFELIWHLYISADGKYGQVKNNYMLECVRDGWVWFLDNDNLVHPAFFETLASAIEAHPNKDVFVFSQVGGNKACPENMVKGRMDAAQFVLRRSMIGHLRFNLSYTADAEMLIPLYENNRDAFKFLDVPVIEYNGLIRKIQQGDITRVKEMNLV